MMPFLKPTFPHFIHYARHNQAPESCWREQDCVVLGVGLACAMYCAQTVFRAVVEKGVMLFRSQ